MKRDNRAMSIAIISSLLSALALGMVIGLLHLQLEEKTIFYRCPELGKFVTGIDKGYLAVYEPRAWYFKTNEFINKSELFIWIDDGTFSILNPDCYLLYNDNYEPASSESEIADFMQSEKDYYNEEQEIIIIEGIIFEDGTKVYANGSVEN